MFDQSLFYLNELVFLKGIIYGNWPASRPIPISICWGIISDLLVDLSLSVYAEGLFSTS